MVLIEQNTMSGLSLLNEVVKCIEQDKDVIRLKKLIYCACTDSWENDANTINSWNFPELVSSLIPLYPNIDQLSTQLYGIANSLSRPVVYSVVAGKAINYVSPLYQGQVPEAPLSYELEVDLDKDSQLSLVVEELEKDQEITRIKKLLLCSRTGKWESDRNVLAKLNIREVIADILTIYPSIDKFSQAICSIVSSLSKPVIYAGVAQIIISQIDRLYNQPQNYTETVVELAETLEKLDVFAEKIDDITLGRDINNDPGETFLDNQPTQLKYQKNGNSDATEIVVKKKSTCPPKKNISRDLNVDYNPFNLRLNLMKYTNPLRAKILIFSALYRPFKGGHDWSAIKDYELDDLLLSLFCKYQNCQQLESQLYQTAKSLHEPEEYNQAAGAIIQSMQALSKSN